MSKRRLPERWRLKVTAPSIGLEGIGDRVGAVAGPALGAEAVHVGAPAEAEVDLAVAQRPQEAPLVDEALRVAGVGGDDAAELVDPRVGDLVGPAVAGDDARVAVGLEHVEHLGAGDGAEVVGVDDHPLRDQAADGVAAEVGESPRVAVGRRGIERRRARRRERLEAVGDHAVGVVRGELRVVVGPALAGLHLPELAGLEEVGAVDDDPGLAGVPRDPAEGVVELVDQLHVADAERVHLVRAGS